MNKILKYVLLICAILALFMLPFILDFMELSYDEFGESDYIVVYFMDNTSMLSQEIRSSSISTFDTQTIRSIFDWMKEPISPNNTSLFENTNLHNFRLINNEYNNILQITLSSNYHLLEPYQKLLLRAGLVHTFTNLDSIDYVSIYVGGQPLLSPLGEPIGLMGDLSISVLPDMAPQVLERVPRWFNLYFVRNDLAGLYVEPSWIDFDQDTLFEEAVLQELLRRGLVNENRLFFPSDLAVIEMSIIENVAYIDFTNHLDTRPSWGELAQLLSIYAIVNTLTGLDDTNIEEIEFLVEGERLVEYNGYVNLGRSFTRDEYVIIE